MCGIAGVLSLTGVAPSEEVLSRMISDLRHRGPDGTGFKIDGPVGFGHSRLAIIDLETGTQPIRNETGDVWVVFNGEIFNYIELRADLLRRGHNFYTQSDTEVIVHLYEEYGLDFVNYLNGQFAIALWDANLQRLVLTRDRPGILPLHYCRNAGRLIFGSEIKAILRAIGERPSLNFEAMDQLLTFWAPLSPNTVFDDVFEVPPGCQLVIEAGKITQRKYWEWEFSLPGDYRGESSVQLAEEALELLRDAIEIRLRADVPVGAYLSGGLDSSVLAALIRKREDVSLRTFSLEFSDTKLNEAKYQQLMVDYIGSLHTGIRCQTQSIVAKLPGCVWHAETPMLRLAPVPMSVLSGHVRDQNYRVVLTGEGADEVFGGYDIFKEAKLRRFWARNPQSKFRANLLQRLYPYLDLSKKQGRAYLEKFFGVGIDDPQQPLFSHLTRIANTSHCKVFLAERVKESLKRNVLEAACDLLPSGSRDWDYFNRAQFLEARTLMSGYLLSTQGDRMLMMNSVEGRFPYLDHRLIEFANQIDPRLKMRVLNEKFLLKEAARDHLPESIVRRYKQPYRAPDASSIAESLVGGYAADLMTKEAVDRIGYFDGRKVERLVAKARKGLVSSNRDSMALVVILTTQLWHELFVTGVSPESLSH